MQHLCTCSWLATLSVVLAAGCVGPFDEGDDLPYANCARNPSHPRCDAEPPTVAITSPSSGSTVTGQVSIAGTASDDRAVARVEVQVDGGAFALATGTTTWSFSFDSAGFADGSHTIVARAVDRGGNTATDTISLEVDGGGTDPMTGVGPQPAITCPAGAVDIFPGQDIPSIVGAAPANTTFCIRAGVHTPTAPINPRSGQVLIGEYGAIIDGTDVSMAFDIGSTSIIRGWNCTGCADVTVRNLVLRNLADHNCVGMFNGGDNWIVDHNEMTGCSMGINMGIGSRVTYNYVHHNRSYAMGGFRTFGNVVDHNEIAYSGGSPDPGGSTACTKWGGDVSGETGGEETAVTNLTITNNYVHHCNTTGLWLDGAGSGNVIAGNRIEDNVRGGVEWEVSLGGTVHDNTFRGNGGVAIFISNSHDVEIYDNSIEQATGMALDLFVDANRLSISNNFFHGNDIDLTAHPASPAVALSCINTSSCAGFGTPNGNRFDGNVYHTGGRTGAPLWMWGGGGLSFSQWRAVGQDVNGVAD